MKDLTVETERASKTRHFVAVSPAINMTALNYQWDSLHQLLRQCQQLLDSIDEFEQLRAMHNQDLATLNTIDDSLANVLKDSNATASDLQSSLDRHIMARQEIESKINEHLNKCKNLVAENRLPTNFAATDHIRDMEQKTSNALNNDHQLCDTISGRIKQIRSFEDAKANLGTELAAIEATIRSHTPPAGDDESGKKKKKKGKKPETISAEISGDDEETLRKRITAQMVAISQLDGLENNMTQLKSMATNLEPLNWPTNDVKELGERMDSLRDLINSQIVNMQAQIDQAEKLETTKQSLNQLYGQLETVLNTCENALNTPNVKVDELKSNSAALESSSGTIDECKILLQFLQDQSPPSAASDVAQLSAKLDSLTSNIAKCQKSIEERCDCLNRMKVLRDEYGQNKQSANQCLDDADFVLNNVNSKPEDIENALTRLETVDQLNADIYRMLSELKMLPKTADQENLAELIATMEIESANLEQRKNNIREALKQKLDATVKFESQKQAIESSLEQLKRQMSPEESSISEASSTAATAPGKSKKKKGKKDKDTKGDTTQAGAGQISVVGDSYEPDQLRAELEKAEVN